MHHPLLLRPSRTLWHHRLRCFSVPVLSSLKPKLRAWGLGALLWGALLTTGSTTGTAWAQSNPSDPASRALRARFLPRPGESQCMVGGVFQGSSDGNSWSNLATISTLPPSDAYTEIALGSSPYRYLRYVGPADGYVNVTELEFYLGATRLQGAGFGSSGSVNNDPNYTFDKALDGDVNTLFVHFSNAPGLFVGIDTGPVVPELGSWMPGAGIATQGIRYPNQVVGGVIRGGGIRRLNAYTATDWDLWTRAVSGIAVQTPVADVCSYVWSASAGSFPEGAQGSTALWQAPSVTATTLVTLTLTVRDQGGLNKGLFESGARANSPQLAADPPVQFSVQISVDP